MNRASDKASADDRRVGFFFSLKSRMLVYFAVVFTTMLVILVTFEIYGIPFTRFEGEYQERQKEIFKDLNIIADLKKERLQRWLEERRDDTKVISESNLIKAHVGELIDRHNTMSGGEKGGSVGETLQLDEAQYLLSGHLELIKATYGVYSDIIIAEAETGAIIAAAEDYKPGADISTEDYFMVVKTTNRTYLDIKKSAGNSGRFHLYISRAIAQNNRKIAVLVMLVDTDDFIRPFLHTGGGLGKTGEALLVDGNVRLLTSLKHPLKDGSIAVPLEYKIRDKPATLAAEGGEGIIDSEDYRGVRVFAAYRHIRISPEKSWGMVVKHDRAEAFAPLQRHILYFIIMGTATIVIVLILTGVIAGRLLQPISKLSDAARAVESGDLNVQAPVGRLDEAGTLTTTFNSMVRRVKAWHRELEEQVEARTTELENEIIERKKATEETKQLAEELARKNEELQQIIYVASHDLRSPLVNIQGFSKELEESFKEMLSVLQNNEEAPEIAGKIHPIINNDIMESLQYILTSTAKMDSLIKGLLKLSRIGSARINIIPLDMNGLMSQVVMSFEFKIKEYGITVEVDDLPPCRGDEMQIDQVFSNLLENAIKYLDPSRAGLIRISVHEEAGQAVYCMEDNGMGIAHKYMDKIYNIFYRVDPDSTKGEGLGLTIVKRILEANKGRIWIESNPGTGTKVFISLPSTG